MKRTLTLALTGVLGVAVLTGCSAATAAEPSAPSATYTARPTQPGDFGAPATPAPSSTPPGPGNAEFGVGQRFSAGGRPTLTITVTDPRTSQPKARGRAAANGRYLTVTVRIAADAGTASVDPAAMDFNPLDFYLVDADGQRYTTHDGNVSASLDLDKRLSFGTLNPGEMVTGTLSFDAPTGIVRLAYAPDRKVLRYWAMG